MMVVMLTEAVVVMIPMQQVLEVAQEPARILVPPSGA